MPPHKSSNIKPAIEEALNEGVTYDPDIARLEPGQAFIDKTGAVRPEPASNAYGMDFGDAIRCLKRGQRVQRHGWNGKGMWLTYVHMSEASAARPSIDLRALPWIGMKTADGCFVPWLASQTDVLGDDWRVVA
jgi:hypothetical protein